MAGCAGVARLPSVRPSSACVLAAPPSILALELDESSGVVASPSHPGVFWTHNDSGGEVALFAVDAGGRLIGTVQVEGARNEDWEELSGGPCPGSNAYCLYIADTGDNRERREHLVLYRVPEPDPADPVSAPAEAFTLTLPHGSRDIEAVFVLPGERVFLVTKGRGDPVEVYRLPAPLGSPSEEPLRPERIQTLTRTPPRFARRVTGAAATPDGRLVAVRTYETLHFYVPDADGALTPVPGGTVNLRSLREPQGEAVGFVPGGGIVLTSESGPGPFGRAGVIAHLACAGLPVEW